MKLTKDNFGDLSWKGFSCEVAQKQVEVRGDKIVFPTLRARESEAMARSTR